MDAETKTRLTKARQLIADKEFDAAIAILKDIDHPTARAWLDKLGVDPEENSVIERLKVAGVIIVVLLVVAIAALIVFQVNQVQQREFMSMTATSVRLFLESIATATP